VSIFFFTTTDPSRGDIPLTHASLSYYSASSATVVKLVVIIRLQTAEGEEETNLHYDLLLWADIELGMAIFAASAAALRPLLRHWHLVDGSTDRAKSGGSASDATGPYQEVGSPIEMDRMRKRASAGAVTARPLTDDVKRRTDSIEDGLWSSS
jgi:hypothetical protein